MRTKYRGGISTSISKGQGKETINNIKGQGRQINQ